jgi:hypothetical protein
MISACFPDSSSITAGAYQPSSACLRIVFRDGSCSAYFDVPSITFSSLVNARSKGAFFNSFIRDVFTATRSGSGMPVN